MAIFNSNYHYLNQFMNIPINRALLVNSTGFFDFDLTFLIEGFFFLLLACTITFFFLNPVSDLLDSREVSVDFCSKKSALLICLGSENILTFTTILLEEIQEMERQTNLLHTSVDECLETEIINLHKKKETLLNNFQKSLVLKSVRILASPKSKQKVPYILRLFVDYLNHSKCSWFYFLNR